MKKHQHNAEELEACRQRAEAALSAAAERGLDSSRTDTDSGFNPLNTSSLDQHSGAFLVL